MCFCLSGYMINWWTHRRSLAFSFTALYPVFPGQDTACFVDFPWVFFSDISERLSRALTFSPFTLLDLLVSPFGDFFLFFFSKPDCLLSCAHINPSFPPALLFLFLPSSTVPSLLVSDFWAMLSSPTVILQPYGLPVYPQTTTCYPSIVQVNSFWFTLQSVFIFSVTVHKYLSPQDCIIRCYVFHAAGSLVI